MQIAVVGMACRLPGATNLEEFWRLLEESGAAIGELPPGRLNHELYVGPRGTLGKTYCTVGGVVPEPNPSEFDEFPAFVHSYGAIYRQVLAVSAEALRLGGFPNPSSAGKNVGFYLCHATAGEQSANVSRSTLIEDTVARFSCMAEFRDLPAGQRAAIERAAIERVHAHLPKRQPGGSPFDTPGRGVDLVPRCFGWEGPVMAIDAACASSLQGLSLAVNALKQGQCDLAVVAGASRGTIADLVVFSQAQALGQSGSFPFDARADGFITSDGYCAVVVEPLDRALAAGRTILGVIKALGSSTDGRGRSLWAPRKEGQVLAIERAWGTELERSSLQYVEAHATSTKVGDAVELESLNETLGRHSAPGRRIPIASVKANVGHTKEAAGLTSLIKVLLALRHRRIPGARYFETPQEGVDWDASAFYVPTESIPWPEPPRGNPRRAAVNSFGIGGLNLHVVIDEYTPATTVERNGRAYAREAAIVGRGCVFPGSHTLESLARLFASSASAIAPVPADRWDSATYSNPGAFRTWRSPVAKGGFVTDYQYDWKRHKIPPLQVDHADPLQFMVLDAASQALDEAGLGLGRIDPSRTAVVVATSFGGEFAGHLNRSLFLPEFEQVLRETWISSGAAADGLDAAIRSFRDKFLRDLHALHDETGGFSSSPLASRIARTFNLMGGAFALDAGEASSGVAIDAAVAMLAAGQCDAVVCAGAQRSMGIESYEELASHGIFDEGVVPGEGAGVVVLVRPGDARRDRSKTYGFITKSAASFRSGRRPLRQDDVSLRIGHTLAASGMASLLKTTVEHPGVDAIEIVNDSLAGVSAQFTFEPLRPDSPLAPRVRPRIAMAFAGQGSQYEGMLRSLVANRPEARAAMDEFDALLLAGGLPSFAEMAWAGNPGLGRDLLPTQLAVLGAGYILHRCALGMGCVPDVVLGHSYGEYGALVAAGCITLEQAIRITRERTRLMESDPATKGSLLAVVAGVEAVRGLIAKTGLPVYLAICNGAEQTVVGGTQDSIEAFALASEAAGVHTRALAVPRPFHTPLLLPVRTAFRELLEDERIRPPRVPFLGSVHSRYISEPSEIKDHLAEQLVSTIHYGETVARLIAESDDLALVEIGPRQVLTGLHRASVGDKVQAFATDHPVRCGEYLARLSALADGPSVCAVRSPIVFFDATERRRKKNLTVAEALPVSAPASNEDDSTGMAGMLIQFVCEQTGYPKDVVDLDADLEADLGIDSIKKARLIGELHSRNLLPIPSSVGRTLTMRDFPTLRSILKVLGSNGAEPAGIGVGAPRLEPVRAAQPQRRPLILRGAPYDMGRQQADYLGPSIHSLLERYGQTVERLDTADLPRIRAKAEERFGNAGVEELSGLADGLAIPLDYLLTFNSASTSELPQGCAQMAIRVGESIFHGANEDSHLAVMMADRLVPIAQIRRPKDGIPNVLLSVPGRIGGLNGMNEAGLAISSTALLGRSELDANSRGLFHPALVKLLLETATDCDEAVRIIRDSERAQAWSMVLSHRDRDDFVHLEYDSAGVEIRHAARAADMPGQSNFGMERLQDMLAGCTSLRDARSALRDRFDIARGRGNADSTMNTPRRVDNLYSAVFLPRTGEVWWTFGKDSEERTERISLADPVEEQLEPADAHSRYILRTVDCAPAVSSPASATASDSLRGGVLISTKNALGEDLAKLLALQSVPLVDSIAAGPRCLILTEGRGEEEGSLAPLRETFQLCKEWIAKLNTVGKLAGSSVIAITSLGGDFGLSGRIPNILGGAISGLLKAISKEFPELQVKVIDAPVHEPRLARFVLDELSVADTDLEIASVQGSRRVLRAIAEAAKARTNGNIAAGASWIVTGGARGITALVARALALRYGLKLHLLGTTALDGSLGGLNTEEVRRNLVTLAEENIDATYYTCDVAQRERLAEVLAQIRSKETISGVVHGAGFEYAGSFIHKSAENFHKTIDSKVLGAQNLIELTAGDPISHFLAFGSISGRFGGLGQTDYSMASELLAKVVQRYRRQRPGVAAATFHWPAWDTAGMAMRQDSYLVLSLAGHKFLRAQDGIRRLLREIEAGVPEGEVLIAPTGAGPGIDSVRDSRVLVTDRIIGEVPGEWLETEVMLDPSRYPFLRDHIWRGSSMLPAAASAVMMLEAARLFDSAKDSVCLRDFAVENPLKVGAEPVSVRVRATLVDGGIRCELVTEFYSSKGRLIDARRLLATGTIEFARENTVNIPPIDADALAWEPLCYPSCDESESRGLVFLGPSMQCVREAAPLPAGIATRVIAPATTSAGALDPAFLDACFVTCALYCLMSLKVCVLAHGFGALHVYRLPRPGERCVAQAVPLVSENDLYAFDVSIRGEDGDVILTAARCTSIDPGVKRAVSA